MADRKAGVTLHRSDLIHSFLLQGSFHKVNLLATLFIFKCTIVPPFTDKFYSANMVVADVTEKSYQATVFILNLLFPPAHYTQFSKCFRCYVSS